MKRLAGLVLCVVLLTAGCRPKQEAPPITADFSCSFSAQYGDMTVAGRLLRHTAGTLQLEFTQPPTLDGMTAAWDGEKVTLKLLGLSFDVDPDDVPEGAVGRAVMGALDGALRGEVSGSPSGKTTIYEGRGQSGTYILVCDRESGRPLSLSVPSLSLSAEFFEYE